MDSTWSEAIVDFEGFLSKAGLVCQRREGPDPTFFGNRLLQYGNGSIGVRLILDRSFWMVDVADLAGCPEEWYDAALLRDLLLGPGQDVVPFADQIAFVKANWPGILNCFGPAQREDTHFRVAFLRGERARRRFPDLYMKSEPE